ncbi:MAG: HEAT repeat domain-containing protein [Spirochaeta sp.]|jgi:HEAT repeat protein|nr:HEAT repeat domain-containing protein [Spirochaeta sp.]
MNRFKRHYIPKFRRLLLGLAIVCHAGVVLSAQEDAPRSTLDEWRATLLFGINSEIIDLLPTLTENGEDELAPEVVELFENTSDSEVQEEAAKYLSALEIASGARRAEELLRQYEDRPDRVIVAMTSYLREIGHEIAPETEEALFRLVRDRGDTPGMGAVRLLAAGDTPSSDLIELYRETWVSDEVRGRILIELGERGDPEVFEFVQDVIGADEEATSTLQRYAIDTLGKLGDPRGLETIIRQFDSDDAITRAYATNALAGFDSEEARSALVAALRDEFWRVRVAALESIAERNMTEAIPAVIYKARRDPERRVRLEAIDTLSALDAADGWRLMEEMVVQRSTPLDLRSSILDHLIRERPGKSKDVVMEVINTEWDDQNSRLLDVIGRVISGVEDQRIEPYAERLIDHPNFILQIYALRAVGRSRLMSLHEIADDRSSEGNHRAVRSAAIRSLEQLGVEPTRRNDDTAVESDADEATDPTDE